MEISIVWTFAVRIITVLLLELDMFNGTILAKRQVWGFFVTLAPSMGSKKELFGPIYVQGESVLRLC